LNQGSFPPPTLLGIPGTTSLSATPSRPVCPSRASGWSCARPRDGVSRVACAFLVYMLSPLPRHSDERPYLAQPVPSYQPSPKGSSGRPVHRPFRGLLSVHSHYGLHTRAATVFRGTLYRRLQPLRYLRDCSDYFRLEHFAGWAFHPLESAAFARRTPLAEVARLGKRTFNVQVRGSRSEAEGTTSAACGCPARL